MLRATAAFARVAAVVSFGLGCVIAGQLSVGDYWAVHMPYVAFVLGSAGAACFTHAADLLEA